MYRTAWCYTPQDSILDVLKFCCGIYSCSQSGALCIRVLGAFVRFHIPLTVTFVVDTDPVLGLMFILYMTIVTCVQ